MSKKFDKMAEALEMIKSMSRSKKTEKSEKKEEAQEPKINADVNNDGIVDEKDIEEVKKKISKKKKSE
jgi:hypothetical protein